MSIVEYIKATAIYVAKDRKGNIYLGISNNRLYNIKTNKIDELPIGDITIISTEPDKYYKEHINHE